MPTGSAGICTRTRIRTGMGDKSWRSGERSVGIVDALSVDCYFFFPSLESGDCGTGLASLYSADK